MVFESIVVELINRYLGTFVENLDTSQLKIGIWGGDVVLNSLNIKESALDDLDLPVKIKAGHIGKLTLKIPWKNLYSEAVVAQIDGIYALAVPNIAIKYDEEKDKAAIQDAKQALLAKIEEQKKLEAEKDKPRDPKQDSFVEKLATQVIKNLQIKVSNIHVRYEDKYTNPARPFAIGVTLQELLFQTTDSNWKETIIKEAVTQIFKLVRLDSLSVYWNSKSKLYQDMGAAAILQELKSKAYFEYIDEQMLRDNIPKQNNKTNLMYLFKPISAVAHLRLNTKPELTDFSLPKIFLTVVFDEIAVALSKDQYDDILEMLESMERIALLSKYKKTRPDVGYKGNAKLWWRHSYAVTLEHTVQRRRRMWSWSNMKKNVKMRKEYREVYARKLDGKRLTKSDEDLLKNHERDLDVFNICLGRNQAEMDVAKLGRKREAEGSTGWFGGWFGGGKKRSSTSLEGSSSSDQLGNKFQEEFTPAEKAKLYSAIGYDENAKDPTYPVEYVAVRLVTKLNRLSVSLVSSRVKENQLLKLTLSEIGASFGQRPAASAIRLDIRVDRLRVAGTPRKDYTPKMVNSIGVSKEENQSLLSVSVETNPMDGQCDTRVRVQSRPVEIIYDAVTIIGMAAFFKPPESVRLKQLSNAAMAKYDQIKAQTTLGMLYMMKERKYADIDVQLMPSYIIVPEYGELRSNVNMLLLNLGALSISSEKTEEISPKGNLSPEELSNYAYDKFHFTLENVQLLFVKPGDSWQEESKIANSSLYVLRPMSLRLLLEKCVIANNPNLPQLRVSGELPLISVNISDKKLLAIMDLTKSIPLPEPGPEAAEEATNDEPTSEAARMAERLAPVEVTNLIMKQPTKEKSDFVNLTQVALSFVLKEISLEILETKQEVETPLLKLVVTRIGMNLKLRTFDMMVDAYLGGIYLQHLEYKVSQGVRDQLKKCAVETGEVINIINSPQSKDDSAPLLSVSFLQADKKGPEFKTTYHNTAQSIVVQFSALDLVLHQGVLFSLMQFAQQFIPPETTQVPVAATAESLRKSNMSLTSIMAASDITIQKITAGKMSPDMFLLRVKALVDSIQLSICNENTVIMHSRVEGIEVGAGMQVEKMGVTALMKKIEVLDPDPKSLHPKIMTVSGSEMLKLELTQVPNGTKGKKFDDINSVDLSIKLEMGRARIVFVNKFVMSLLYFLDNFAVAKAKLDEAGKAVKEASKDVAKNIQENAPRIRLDIKVKAPLVVVPQHSKSLNVLMVNLGDISVQNSFSPYNNQKRPAGQAFIVDKMIVVLTNLRLSRGTLVSQEGDVKSEVNILDPMTFKVAINRNLSTNLYHDIPDVEVVAQLEKITIQLHQEDVTLALLMSTDNLDERDPLSPRPTSGKSVYGAEGLEEYERHDSRVPDESHSMKLHPTVTSDRLQPVSEFEEVGPYSKVKVNFKLAAIGIELYRGKTNLQSGLHTRDPEKMLTQLTIKTLALTLNMLSDSSMNATVNIHDFNMDDCRVEKQAGITKLIRRTAFKELTKEALQARTKEETTDMLINLTFEQNNRNDQVVVLHMCSLHICLYLEFLMKVVDFFTRAMPKCEPKTITHQVVAQADYEKKANETAMSAMSAKPSIKEGPSETETIVASRGTLDVTVQLDKPEIYLIEDQMNPDTSSLIVDLELNFRLRQTPDVLSLNASISRLSLVSCIFSQPGNKQMVLSPVDIAMVGSGPQGRDHHIEVTVSDFIINISPATIRLLTAITSGMAVQTEEESTQPNLKDFSDIWLQKSLEQCAFWFTHSVVDIGTSVDRGEVALALNTSPQRGELLILSAPVIVMKLEGGVGHRTIPLLIVESSFTSQVQNWSSEMYIESSLSVEVAYNNEKLGVWEPILEPVVDNVKAEPHKWELTLEVVRSDELVPEDDQIMLPPPKLTINVTALEPLQLILTKTCLDVLSNLGQAFSEAYQLREMEGTLGQKVIPYVVKNLTGREFKMKPDAVLEVAAESSVTDLTSVPTGGTVHLNLKSWKELAPLESIIRSTQHHEEKRIAFQMADSEIRHELSIKQAKKRLFTCGEDYQVLVDVEAHIGQMVISFASILEVKNHLTVPVEIYYPGSSSSEMFSTGTVYPEGSFAVPLIAVYTPSSEISFKALVEGGHYKISNPGINWKNLNPAKKTTSELHCDPINTDISVFHFNVLPEFEKIYHESTEDKTDQMIILHIHPTVIFHNLLPLDVEYKLEQAPGFKQLAAGHHVPLNHASVNKTTIELEIPMYRGFKWTGKKLIKLDVPELSVWTFEANDAGVKRYMDLGLHCKVNGGSYDLSLYCPYWIVNLTEQVIAVKEDDKEAPLTHSPEENKGIMLYFFRDKPMFGSGTKRKESTSDKKKEKVVEVKQPGKVMLKIGSTDWSDKFSLDTVGSGGSVTCKNKAAGNTVEVGLKITLTASGLTKIVTFTPFYLLLNASAVSISIQEEKDSEWLEIQSGECTAFYPKQTGKEMKIRAKVTETSDGTQPFFFNKAHVTLLRLDNKYGGIQAECQVSESSMITTFKIFQWGMASVQFVNHTSQCTVHIKQSGTNSQFFELNPLMSQLYTWDDPTGMRQITWSCGNKRDAKSALDQDNIEEFFAKPDVKVYFVSFLDGLQRVVMFTEDLALATVAQEAGELEQADQEINIRIQDMGFSLINNEKMLEIAYMGITSSGVIWEEKKKRYKAMKVKDMGVLEHAYQKYLSELAIGKRAGNVMLENKLEVNFDNMEMVRPKQCQIRRSFMDGIWIQLRTSPHSMQLHAKINRLQFDDQLRHAVFPTLLSPIPPPKSVAADSIPKPFVEVSLMTRIHEHSSLVQIKYFKVLIQEMNLKVDQGFLSVILDMFASDVNTLREQEVVLFKADIASTQRDLKEEAGVSLQAQRIMFYDYFHISPIKVHVSFSLQGGSLSDTPQAQIMGVFLQSVGVVLTDVQDVVFKLGYFERNHSFYNNSQLTTEFIRHYSGQAMKQMYVLILGLDVLGNPFGLLRGLSEGIEDLFYEPYQGAIQGPQEFAEGLALGVRSLFGHAVGGAAGAVSRITGTLGKGLAALTLDDDYQKKRREQLNKRPATASEGFARGGKGLVMGVFDGVTGIVRKPVEGAKQEGVAGFFKGVGKGLVGVVTRPTSGVVDFASSSLEGIRRITDFTEEVRRLRPPRHFMRDGVVRPYILEEAEGYSLLVETDKGKYLETDEYVTHVKVKEDGKIVFIVTDKRVMVAKRGEVFGAWDTDWVFTYDEMKGAPKQTSKGIEIFLKDREKKKLFGSNVAKREVVISDPKVAATILAKILEVMAGEKVESGV